MFAKDKRSGKGVNAIGFDWEEVDLNANGDFELTGGELFMIRADQDGEIDCLNLKGNQKKLKLKEGVNNIAVKKVIAATSTLKTFLAIY